jgi:hypothetical protein
LYWRENLLMTPFADLWALATCKTTYTDCYCSSESNKKCMKCIVDTIYSFAEPVQAPEMSFFSWGLATFWRSEQPPMNFCRM